MSDVMGGTVVSLGKRSLPSQMFASSTPGFHNRTVQVCFSWNLCLQTNDPIRLSRGTGWMCLCVSVHAHSCVFEGVLMMRQRTWQNNHIRASGHHSSKWAPALTCSVIWLLLTNLILQMKIAVCVCVCVRAHFLPGKSNKVMTAIFLRSLIACENILMTSVWF